MEIKGKKVAVFGGASGMGRASAELLAARGADIAVLDRPGSGGGQVATALGSTCRQVLDLDAVATFNISRLATSHMSRNNPEEYAKLVAAIVDNPMLNGQCLRLDAGQRFAPK